MLNSNDQASVVAELRRLLRDLFVATERGSVDARQARTQADEYMRGLLGRRVFTQKELLAVVAEERARAFGPATRTLPKLDELPRGSA